MKIYSATAARAGRMHEHPWAAHRMDGRHPGEPCGLTAFPGTCWQVQGVNSPSTPVTNWALYHSSHMVSRGTFNAGMKADVQGDKEERYQEQGLLQSGRICKRESEGCIGGPRI